MLVTACLTCRLLRKPTCCSRRRGEVCFCARFARCRHTDFNSDLVTYCEKEDVPFTTFNDFSDIHATVKEIVEGKLTVKQAATGRK